MRLWKWLCGRDRLRAYYSRWGYVQLFCGYDICEPGFAAWVSWGVPCRWQKRLRLYHKYLGEHS